MFCYGFGMLLGPQAIGIGMDLFGPPGFGYALALFFVAYLAAGSPLRIVRIPGAGLTFRRPPLCVAPSFRAGPQALIARPSRQRTRQHERTRSMAKAAKIKIKLLSTADTGFFYVTSKNSRTKTDKLSLPKYDPVAKKHVEFKETKIK